MYRLVATGILDGIFDFFYNILIKFASRLPSNPFSLSTYFDSLSGILGNLNYFIPFYLFSAIFNVWIVAFTACVSIFIVMKIFFFGRNK